MKHKDIRLLDTLSNLITEVSKLNGQVISQLDITTYLNLPLEGESIFQLKGEASKINEYVTYVIKALEAYETK